MDFFNIFYSWQSDVDKKVNNYFIKSCLEKTIKDIAKDDSIKIIPRLDKDTEGKIGSPNIVDSIFEKINACQIFVADVTVINNTFFNRLLKNRLTPNPNVLIELGYAVSNLSWERVICINNNHISKVEDMPFDIKQNRISVYSYDGKEDKAQAKERVANLLKLAIKSIIHSYDSILENQNKSNVVTHDIRIYQGYATIIPGNRFIELIEHVATNQIIERDGYRVIDSLIEYLESDDNLFMIEELKEAAMHLVEKMNVMRMILATNFHAEYEEYYDEVSGEVVKRYYYKLLKEPQWYKTWKEYEEVIDKKRKLNNNSIDESIREYREFRSLIKKHLYL